MFNDNQIKSLESELDSNRIKTRSKGNVNLSYLEGFSVIETANKVFGYGNWSYNISKLEQVSQEKNQNDNTVVCYKAIIKLMTYDTSHSKDVSREDVGFGTGIAKTLSDAHESGAKEAVTDALKRTLRSFGNQFGNSLYDKTKKHNTQSSNSNQNQSPNASIPPQNVNNPQDQDKNQSPNIQHSPQTKGFDQYEYQSLYNLGLTIVEQNGFLLVTGGDIFSKKDSIKACGFRWDGKTKQWYKVLTEQGAA